MIPRSTLPPTPSRWATDAPTSVITAHDDVLSVELDDVNGTEGNGMRGGRSPWSAARAREMERLIYT
jgi:hypothetical protein